MFGLLEFLEEEWHQTARRSGCRRPKASNVFIVTILEKQIKVYGDSTVLDRMKTMAQQEKCKQLVMCKQLVI